MDSSERKELLDLVRSTQAMIETQLRAGHLSDPTQLESSKGPPITSPSKLATLEEIRTDLGDCTRCKLHPTRTNIVFGVGNPKADLVFVGEGPGRDEDLQGEPFVGRAGKLLTDIIEAIGLKRSDVYICNVVKCRPPENRNPEPDEIEKCEPFLRAQIDAVSPQLICALGKFAVQTLLRVETPISKLRGKFFDYHGVPLMPTYHPAYLLRNPSSKKEVWEDMKVLHAQLVRLTGKTIARKGS